jgi:ABC-type Na+ transport system ATPase subunit NatA
MKHYQDLTTATDEVNASVQDGKITDFLQAHSALLTAERRVLSAQRARQ